MIDVFARHYLVFAKPLTRPFLSCPLYRGDFTLVYRVPRFGLLGGMAGHSMQMVTSNSHLQNSSSSMETTSLKGALNPPQNPPPPFRCPQHLKCG